jgi:hypothetical protein
MSHNNQTELNYFSEIIHHSLKYLGLDNHRNGVPTRDIHKMQGEMT